MTARIGEPSAAAQPLSAVVSRFTWQATCAWIYNSSACSGPRPDFGETVYFSDAFGIHYSRDDEWFDPILERDTPLFVDPFTIFADRDESWRQAHDTIIDYFHNAFEILAESGLRQTHQLYRRTLTLMEFPEPREFRLGYASKNADGSGSGPGLARLIVIAMGEAINTAAVLRYLIMGRFPGRGGACGGGTSGRGPGAGVATGTSAVRGRCCAGPGGTGCTAA